MMLLTTGSKFGKVDMPTHEPRCRRCGHPKLGHTISLTCPAGTLDNWRGMGYRETRYEAEDEKKLDNANQGLIEL